MVGRRDQMIMKGRGKRAGNDEQTNMQILNAKII